MVLAGHDLRLPGRGAARGRCAGGQAWGSRPGVVGRAPLRRLAGADVGARRAAGAARLGRARDRRGDRGGRPGRRVAGPRRGAGDGLAGPPSRALRAGEVVHGLRAAAAGARALTSGGGPGRRGQSGRTVRKQSEQ